MIRRRGPDEDHTSLPTPAPSRNARATVAYRDREGSPANSAAAHAARPRPAGGAGAPASAGAVAPLWPRTSMIERAIRVPVWHGRNDRDQANRTDPPYLIKDPCDLTPGRCVWRLCTSSTTLAPHEDALRNGRFGIG